MVACPEVSPPASLLGSASSFVAVCSATLPQKCSVETQWPHPSPPSRPLPAPQLGGLCSEGIVCACVVCVCV